MAKKPGKETKTENDEEIEEIEETSDEETVEDESEESKEILGEDEEIEEKPKKSGKKSVDITDGARKNQATHESTKELKSVVEGLKSEIEGLTAKIESFFTDEKKSVKKTEPPKSKKEPRRDMYGFRYEWDKDSE